MQEKQDFEKNEKLAMIVRELPAVKREVMGIEVNSPETQARAAELIARIKGYIKEIDTQYKAWSGPFNDVLSVARGIVKERKKPYEKLLDIIAISYTAYQDELDRRARADELKRLQEQKKRDEEIEALKKKEAQAKTDAEQERIQEKIEAAKAQPVAVAPKVEKSVKTESGSVSVRKYWTYEIIDRTKIPAEYLTIDAFKINRAITSDKVRDIPGLRIYEKSSVSGRGT